MSVANGNIEAAIRGYILDALILGHEGEAITDTTHLVEAGVVDSINVLRLVEFIEETFDIMLEPQELHQLISIANIAGVVRSKGAG